MKVHLNSYDPAKLLQSAASHLDAPVSEDCQKWRLDLPPSEGEGSLLAYDFENGWRLLLLQAELAKTWRWKLVSPPPSPLLLLFAIRGKVALQSDGERAALNPLQPLFATHPGGSPASLLVEGGAETVLLLLAAERAACARHLGCLPKPVELEMSALLSDKASVKSFRSDDGFGIACAALVKEMLADKQQGLVHATLVQAKALEIFSIQLKHWEADVAAVAKKPSLRPEDLEKILFSRNVLVQDLQNAPDIGQLAKLAGINRQKLKQGFRRVFKQGVNEYLRNERLKAARRLLAVGRQNIGEVATVVGYDNAGYFARRFKEKYGVLPREFLAAMDGSEEE